MVVALTATTHLNIILFHTRVALLINQARVLLHQSGCVFLPGLLAVSRVGLPHVEVDYALTVGALDLLLAISSIYLVVVPASPAVLVLGIASHLVGSSTLLLLHQIYLILRRILLSLVSQVLSVLHLLVLPVEVLLIQASKVEDTTCLLATSLGCLGEVLIIE